MKTRLAILFVTTILMTSAMAASSNLISDVEAAKGQGVPTSNYGSKTGVCGDRLCSEIPGGKAAWDAGERGSSLESEDDTDEAMKDKDHAMKDEKMKDKDHAMKDEKMKDKDHAMKDEKMTAHHSWSTSTGTMTSIQDPGIGHEAHQLAIILPPSDKIYKGILSYSASEPIQLVALHGPLAEGEDNGQPIWTPDGETKFALTFVDKETAMGSWLFTGNALAVHTMNEDPFTVSYTVNYMEKASSETVMTGTTTSIQDPGIGHEAHQLAIILPPSDKAYSGLLTYSASEPIQLVALHGPLAEGEDNGQPIWTPDGETKFALTFVDKETAMGTWKFAGNALAVHTLNEDTFTVSYSVVAGQ